MSLPLKEAFFLFWYNFRFEWRQIGEAASEVIQRAGVVVGKLINADPRRQASRLWKQNLAILHTAVGEFG